VVNVLVRLYYGLQIITGKINLGAWIMLYSKVILSAALSLTLLSLSLPANAQSQSLGQPIEIIDETAKPITKRRIKRVVEPVPYWVDVDQLRIRDNPVAGDVVGMLRLGQKIKAYDTFENWIRVSKPNAKQQWVNAKFLTHDQVTWARFDNDRTRRRNLGFTRNTAANDISLKRIKVPSDKSAKIFAASLKKTANNNRVIVTRQNFRSGPYFEKRIVSCDGQNDATHFQLLGEGYNYIMMEKDIRSQNIDLNSVQPRVSLAGENISAKSAAIAQFSCNSSGLGG